jgi:phosphohistidine phosphatase
MELLILRHAIAFPRDSKRWPDDAKRALTMEGAKRARRAAAGLKRMAKRPTLVLTSPLVRARDTAAILAECVAVVGHQPHLGRLLALSLRGDTRGEAFELKKSAVACVHFDGSPSAHQGTLMALFPPKALREV